MGGGGGPPAAGGKGGAGLRGGDRTPTRWRDDPRGCVRRVPMGAVGDLAREGWWPDLARLSQGGRPDVGKRAEEGVRLGGHLPPGR